MLPGFSPNHKFWGCRCTPASYTSALLHCAGRNIWPSRPTWKTCARSGLIRRVCLCQQTCHSVDFYKHVTNLLVWTRASPKASRIPVRNPGLSIQIKAYWYLRHWKHWQSKFYVLKSSNFSPHSSNKQKNI